MDTMTMHGDDVRHELQDLEKAQGVHAATQLGGASHPSGDASRWDGDHGRRAGRHGRGCGSGRHWARGRYVSRPGDGPHHAYACVLTEGHGCPLCSLASAVRRGHG